MSPTRLPEHVRNPVGVNSFGANSFSPNGMPCLSASASVNTLNVEPACMPRLEPWSESAARLTHILPFLLLSPSLRSMAIAVISPVPGRTSTSAAALPESFFGGT